MIGRTAPSNPWIFRQIEQYCAAMRMRTWMSDAVCGNSSAAVEQADGLNGALDGQHRASARGAEGGCPHMALPATAKLYDEPSEADRYQMIRTYFQMLIEEELPDAVGKMKQFASWFTHGVPGGAGLRKAIYESKSAPEILSRVEEFFEARLCGAREAVTIPTLEG